MEGTLDVARDHPELIKLCLKLLKPGGKLLFVANLSSFKLSPELSPTEMTSKTIPPDFHHRKIHHSYLFTA